METCPIEIRRWVTEYTALGDIYSEDSVAIGDEFNVPTREIPTDTWRQRFRIWVDKQLTPPNEYHNIHLENNMVTAKVIDIDDSVCVLEIVHTLKHYGRKSLFEYVTEPR